MITTFIYKPTLSRNPNYCCDVTLLLIILPFIIKCISCPLSNFHLSNDAIVVAVSILMPICEMGKQKFT